MRCHPGHVLRKYSSQTCSHRRQKKCLKGKKSWGVHCGITSVAFTPIIKYISITTHSHSLQLIKMSDDIWLTVRNVCNAFPYNNIHLVLLISHFVFHLSYSHTVFVNMGNTSENYQNMLNIIFVNGLKNNWSLPKLCLKIWPYFDKLQSNYLCYRIVSNADYNQQGCFLTYYSLYICVGHEFFSFTSAMINIDYSGSFVWRSYGNVCNQL